MDAGRCPLLLLAFGIWLAVVAPVNGEVAEALRGAGVSASSLDAAPQSVGVRTRGGIRRAARWALCACTLGVSRDAEEPPRDRAAGELAHPVDSQEYQ